MGAMRILPGTLLLLLVLALPLAAAPAPLDLSAYGEGPVAVESVESFLVVRWQDEAGRPWRATFDRDPARPLIASMDAGDAPVLRSARPFYRVETGVRRKGWNAFFDYPPTHPAGTRAFFGEFELDSMRVETVGNRVRVVCGGFRAGPFSGSLVFTFFPGSRLVQQQAVVSTSEPHVAFLYDAGIEFSAPGQVRPGRNMSTPFAYYDTEGRLREEIANGFQPERVPRKVRYRALASAAGAGSVAAFPAPHQYFFPRDFTSNLSQNWHRS